MPDPIQLATSVVVAIKKALDVSNRLKDAEIQGILLDAQEKAIELREEVLNLRNDNAPLRENLDAKSALKYDRGAYWSEVDGSRDGPFCSRCWDADSKRIRMHYWGLETFWQCPQCKKEFDVKSAPRGPS